MSTGKPKSGMWYLHYAITVLIMLAFAFVVPTVGEITAYGMRTIGILIGVIYGFATVGTLWAALTGVVALGISGGAMASTVASALGTPMIWGVILIQVIMYALAKEGVTTFFANWIISRKVVKGRPWLYSFFILLGAFIVSIVSPFPALLMFWDIVYATCDNFKQPHNCRWGQFMIFGVTFSAGLGVVSLPMLTSNGITVFANYAAIAGESMNAIKYVIALVPLMLASVVIYILLCKFVFKPDITAFKDIDVTVADQNALKMDTRKVVVIVSFIALLLIMFLPYLLPSGWALTTFLSNLGLFGACATVILFLAFFRIDGTPLLNVQEAASKNIQWSTVFMVALLMPLGSAISSSDSGILATITGVLSPILNGTGVYVFAVLIVLIGLVLTNVSQNLVVIGILMPVVGAVAGSGVNLAVMTVLIALSTHYACALPSASFVTGIMFSNENVTNKFLYKYGIITCAICGVFAATVGYFWCSLIF